MSKTDVIYELTEFYYDSNCTDKGLMFEWIRDGHTFPGYDSMSIEELKEEYEEFFDEVIDITE